MIKAISEFQNLFLKPPDIYYREYSFTFKNNRYIVKQYINKRGFTDFIEIIAEKSEKMGNSYLHIQINIKDIKTILVKQYYVSSLNNNYVFIDYAFIVNSRELNMFLKRKHFELLKTELNTVVLKQIVLKVIETVSKYASEKAKAFFPV